jgi:protein-tyrosine phosphatase
MARAAEAAGVETIVATPHIRDDHPFDLAEIPARAAAVNRALEGEGLALRVVEGGELSLAKSTELDEDALRRVSLGGGPYLLVESPYTAASDLLERDLFALQVRGFRPVLAHPERSPSFLADVDRLEAIVERGVLCSITSGSMAGRFGRTVARLTSELFRRGLVHDVASDAHDPVRRSPDLLAGFTALGDELPGLRVQAAWFTHEAPRAILAGEDLPPRPEPPRRRRSLRRLVRR